MDKIPVEMAERMKGKHVLGLKENGRIIGRFLDPLTEEEFAEVSKDGLPANIVAWHDGTAHWPTVGKYPVVTWWYGAPVEPKEFIVQLRREPEGHFNIKH